MLEEVILHDLSGIFTHLTEKDTFPHRATILVELPSIEKELANGS
jgi:hypothetical protein